MQLRTNQLAAFSALAALGAASLFAQQRFAPRAGQREGRALGVMSTVLNLSDAQKAQVKSIFQDSRQSAQPVRHQLMANRRSLAAAVQAGDADQIQQLSATVGSQMGQLTVIRSSAFAKVYKILTPEQQQKWSAFQQAMHPQRRHAARNTGE